MPDPRFLVVGHSHAICIVEALRSAEPEERHGFVQLGRPPPKSPAARLGRFAWKKAATAWSRHARREQRVHPALPPIVGPAAADIRRPFLAGLAAMLEPPRRLKSSEIPAILEDAGITVLASIGGNAHNVFGLAEFEVPFDFVLPARETLGSDPAKQLVPYDAVRQILQERIRRSLRILAVLRDLAGKRMLVLESPPPIPDDAHILKYAGRFFDSRHGADWKVVSPSTRLKIWRVSSEIYAEFCRETGLVFVPAPAVATDAGMFLKPEGWPPNATHANSWYGARVIEDVAALLGTAAVSGPFEPRSAGRRRPRR